MGWESGMEFIIRRQGIGEGRRCGSDGGCEVGDGLRVEGSALRESGH